MPEREKDGERERETITGIIHLMEELLGYSAEVGAPIMISQLA